MQKRTKPTIKWIRYIRLPAVRQTFAIVLSWGGGWGLCGNREEEPERRLEDKEMKIIENSERNRLGRRVYNVFNRRDKDAH